MVLPTVLKKRHSLKGINLLPVLKKIKTGKPESFKEYARMSKEVRTENMTMEEVTKMIKELTGEDAAELLDLAGESLISVVIIV